MIEVVPLGTGSAIPTPARHLSATVLLREGRLYLFDCGEGTQYQLVRAGLKLSRLDAAFITHLHGDHLYGLPGLLTTLALLERTKPLTVVGPAGLPGIMRSLPGLARDWLPYAIEWVELEEGFEHRVVYETDELSVTARPLDHRVFCAGFRFEETPRPGRFDAAKARALGVPEGPLYGRLQRGEDVTLGDGRAVRSAEVVGPARPGAVFAYILDTRPCANGRRLAEGADLVVHEATFGEAERDRAAETGHSTARDAAAVARDAGARRLLLTHFSARYPEVTDLVAEARTIFTNTDAAEELRRYPVTT